MMNEFVFKVDTILEEAVEEKGQPVDAEPIQGICSELAAQVAVQSSTPEAAAEKMVVTLDEWLRLLMTLRSGLAPAREIDWRKVAEKNSIPLIPA